MTWVKVVLLVWPAVSVVVTAVWVLARRPRSSLDRRLEPHVMDDDDDLFPGTWVEMSSARWPRD